MNNGKTRTFQIMFQNETFLLVVAAVKTEKFNSAACAQKLFFSLYNYILNYNLLQLCLFF